MEILSPAHPANSTTANSPASTFATLFIGTRLFGTKLPK
jgi:hypothetical protein